MNKKLIINIIYKILLINKNINIKLIQNNILNLYFY